MESFHCGSGRWEGHVAHTPQAVLGIFVFNSWQIMLNIDIKLGLFDSVTKQTSKITLIWQLLSSSGNVTTSLNIKLNVIFKKSVNGKAFITLQLIEINLKKTHNFLSKLCITQGETNTNLSQWEVSDHLIKSPRKHFGHHSPSLWRPLSQCSPTNTGKCWGGLSGSEIPCLNPSGKQTPRGGCSSAQSCTL